MLTSILWTIGTTIGIVILAIIGIIVLCKIFAAFVGLLSDLGSLVFAIILVLFVYAIAIFIG